MNSKGPSLSLGDLLSEEAFGLELLTGGENARGRPVIGAHAVEVEHPTRWLSPDWIMLTTGVRLRGHANAQRELVRELEEAGASALGFGVGVVFKRVPAALAEEARAHGFPVFAVPYETAFRDIVRFIDGALLGSDEQAYRRLSALHRFLVDALREAEPERAVVERLARFLDAGVVIFTGAGEPEFVAGDAPVADLGRAVAALPGGPAELEIAGYQAVATTVASRAGRPVRWLALATRRTGFVTRLIKPAAETAAPLLSALARVGDVVRGQEDAVRSALLDEALQPLSAEEATSLATRAASLGLDFSERARVAVIARPARADPGHPALDVGAVRRTLVDQLDRARAPHLVTRRGESIVALVQQPAAALRAALGEVAAAHAEIVIGIGRPIDGLDRVHDSVRDAELGVDAAGLEHGRRLLDFEDFDLGTFIVSEVAPERLRPKLEQTLSVLRANPLLHETLLAFFDHDLEIAATASAMHLHPNSLRYRLSRLEKLLGRSLKQPSTIAGLYIAVLADSQTPASATVRMPSSKSSSA